MKNISKIYNFIILITFCGIFLAEIISIKYSLAGKIGTYLWFFSYLFFFIFAFKSLLVIIRNSLPDKNVENFEYTKTTTLQGNFKYKIKNFFETRNLITPFMLAVWFIIIFINIPQIKNIDGESTQEIGECLNLFHNSNDMGYRKICHLGYSAKQFFLPSLPTLIFGRNNFSLNFGGSLYFLLGILIFSSGILISFDNKKAGDLFCATVLALFFHIHHLNFLLFKFEQSIYPFSFALIICGLLLYYFKNKSTEIILLIGFSMLYMVFSYTVSLALFFPGILLLIYLFLKTSINKKKKILIILIIFITLISFVLSLQYRQDLRFADSGNPLTINGILFKILEILKHLFYHSMGVSPITPAFTFIFLFILFSSLIFTFGYEMFFISLWIMGVIFASVILKGYSRFSLDLSLHRATIVFPVLFLMLLKIVKSIKFDLKRNYYLLLLIYIFFFLNGLDYQTGFLMMKVYTNEERIRHSSFTLWLEENIPEEKREYFMVTSKTIEKLKGKIDAEKLKAVVNRDYKEENLIDRLKELNYREEEILEIINTADRFPQTVNLYFDFAFNKEYAALNDNLEYFLPDFKSHILAENNSSVFYNDNSYLLVSRELLKSRNNYDNIRPGLEYIDTFFFKNDIPLNLYRIMNN